MTSHKDLFRNGRNTPFAPIFMVGMKKPTYIPQNQIYTREIYMKLHSYLCQAHPIKIFQNMKLGEVFRPFLKRSLCHTVLVLQEFQKWLMKKLFEHLGMMV